MITTAYARAMAAYNAAMNERIYAAAARLPDAGRRLDRGAFWRSIHGTLNHLLWGDRMWMSRLDGWPKPKRTLRESDRLYDTFAELTEARAEADAGLSDWATRLDEASLSQPLSYVSDAAGRAVSASRGLVVVHLFNHQTHHRGQVHAMLTAAGERPGDTDLLLILPPEPAAGA